MPRPDSAPPVIVETATGATTSIAPYRLQRLSRLLYGTPFEIVVISIIIINAVALAVLTYDGISTETQNVALAIDSAVTAFYAVELALRVISYGRKPWMFFRSGWNIFDFLIVVSLPFLGNATVVFRLIRLVRLVRVFRFFPEVRILALSIVKSLAPLASISVLIGFLLFLYAMAGVYLFGDAAPERWGDLGTAIITLIVLLTLENFPDSFTSALDITPWAWLYFLSYMFFIVFTVLNVLIGIVLTAMDKAHDEVQQQADAIEGTNALERLEADLAQLELDLEERSARIARLRLEVRRLAGD